MPRKGAATLNRVRSNYHELSSKRKSEPQETIMSCGWCKIPLHNYCEPNSEDTAYTLNSEKKCHIELYGGTPLNKKPIDPNTDLKITRTGIRYYMNQVFKEEIKPQLHFTVTPIHCLPNNTYLDVIKLPSVFICAESVVSLIRNYRELLATTLHSSPDSNSAQRVPGRNGIYSDPVLSLFPRIMGDPAMATVLQGNWLRMLEGMSSSKRSDHKHMAQAFTNAVLQMWSAFSINSTTNDLSASYNTECYDNLLSRVQMITALTRSNTKPFMDSVVSFNSKNTANPSATITTSQISNLKATGLGSTSSIKDKDAKSKKNTDKAVNTKSQLSNSDDINGQLLLAFHTKEVAFGIEDTI